jgi:hypothetical protein
VTKNYTSPRPKPSPIRAKRRRRMCGIRDKVCAVHRLQNKVPLGKRPYQSLLSILTLLRWVAWAMWDLFPLHFFQFTHISSKVLQDHCIYLFHSISQQVGLYPTQIIGQDMDARWRLQLHVWNNYWMRCAYSLTYIFNYSIKYYGIYARIRECWRTSVCLFLSLLL